MTSATSTDTVTRIKLKMDPLKLIQQEDFMISLDLLDAYFHVLVHPSHRKYLRFFIQGTVYQFRVMPMGLSSSPRAFTHLSKIVKAWAQQQGPTFTDPDLSRLQIQLDNRENRCHRRMVGAPLGIDLQVPGQCIPICTAVAVPPGFLTTMERLVHLSMLHLRVIQHHF